MHYLLNMCSLLYVNYDSIKMMKICDLIQCSVFGNIHLIVIACLQMRKPRPEFTNFRWQAWLLGLLPPHTSLCSSVKAALCRGGTGTRLACAGRGRWEVPCDGCQIGEQSLLPVLPSLPSLPINLFPANISDPWWPFLLNILRVGSWTAMVAMGAAFGNSVLSRRGKGNTYPQVLLRFNCHMTLHKFKVYNIMIWHMCMLQNDHPSKNS